MDLEVQYIVLTLEKKYPDPKQSIENDDFIIEMKTPVVKEIMIKK
jgi:hypothetical protein